MGEKGIRVARLGRLKNRGLKKGRKGDQAAAVQIESQGKITNKEKKNN